VVGSSVADGTYITSGSGSSWTITQSQTVASEGMVSVLPTLTEMTPNINQYPTSTGLDITVTLV
jgi:hypothetical protein